MPFYRHKFKNTLLFLLIFFFCSCGQGDCSGFGDIEITRETKERTLVGKPNATNVPLPENIFPALAINLDFKDELQAQNAERVDGAYLTGLSLQITETAAPGSDRDTFDFLLSIEVFIESTAEGSSLPPQKIAEIKPVPGGRILLELEVDSTVNLKDYADEGAQLIIKGTGHIPSDDVSLKAKATIELELF